MTDYVTLMGAEDVARAGRRMAEAAQSMQSAAANIDHSLTQHQRFMDDWLARFEAALAEQGSAI